MTINGGYNTVPEYGAAAKPPVTPADTPETLRKNGYTDGEIKNIQSTGQISCATCDSRRYTDGSNDPGVSMKSPTKISPEASFAAVSSHEQEHVGRNAAKAASEGNQAVSTVRIFTSTCPECGKTYASGGETRTVTRSREKKEEENDHFFEQQFPQYEGQNFDRIA
jgi:hypothetical protein